MGDIWDEKPTWNRRMSCVDYIKKRNTWLAKMKERFNDLKTDCVGFQKLASESTLRGAENRKKLEAIKKWRESLPQHILDHLDAVFLRLDPKFSLLDALHEILEAS